MQENSSSDFPEFHFEQGEMLLVDKPYKWTSFDVVSKIRNSFKPLKLKVGHAGTLDPLATGLLIICTGKLTKSIDEYQAQDKEYVGTMVLGEVTPSYDMETQPSETFPTGHLTPADILAACKQFIGEIEQFPPAHSAVKMGGERLYEKARRGDAIELRPRQVRISEFEITSLNMPEATFRVVCSKGTYIRSLVNDFGRALNNGAYLKQLRRTKSGSYSVDDAFKVMELVNHLRSLKEAGQLK